MKRLATAVLLAILFGIAPAGINQVSAQSAPQPGDYIVTEQTSNVFGCYAGALSRITPNGQKTVLYSASFCPTGIAIDSEGNYIVTYPTGDITQALARITRDGSTRSLIAAGLSRSPCQCLNDLAIDSEGNYIVIGYYGLTKVTPGGITTEIFSYQAAGLGTTRLPSGIAIDSQGNYIITETEDFNGFLLAKITPAQPNGLRTVIRGGLSYPL